MFAATMAYMPGRHEAVLRPWRRNSTLVSVTQVKRFCNRKG
jgi:hypothetical protein